MLRPGVGVDSLPHQLLHTGGMALVFAPGRAPLCLRCDMTGHVRKNCVAPKCDTCNNFSHATVDCARALATAITGASVTPFADDVMDEIEAEATSGSTPHRADMKAMSPSEQACLQELVREGSDGPPSPPISVEVGTATGGAEPEHTYIGLPENEPTVRPQPGHPSIHPHQGEEVPEAPQAVRSDR